MIDEISALELVAARMAMAGIDVVYAGGVVLPFYVRDQRGTEDIDCFADATEPELGASLRRAKLTHDQASGVVVRWSCDGSILDVIPRTGYFGYDTRWNDLVFLRARSWELPSGRLIRIASPATLLILKIAAFEDRGRKDPLASRDGADIAALAVECPDLWDDLRTLPEEARRYAASWAAGVLAERPLLDALEANVPRGGVAQPGPRFVAMLGAIAGL